MGYPVVHFEVMGKDSSALRKFYTAAFEWQFSDAVPGVETGYTLAQTNAGTGIGGGIGQCPDGFAGHVTFYVGVPDIARAFEKVTRLGGTQVWGPMTVPKGPTIGLFADPEGHVVGLVQVDSDKE